MKKKVLIKVVWYKEIHYGILIKLLISLTFLSSIY